MSPSTSGLIFRGERSGGLMGLNEMNKTMATLDVNDATPHGLRGSFRMWCAEHEVPREAAEICVAHRIGNQSERAYQKSNLVESRRDIMGRWADYCAS
jgi:integrase